MPIPHIDAIAPDRGPTTGQTFVTLVGTGLRLPPPAASIAIRFGQVLATDVRVRTDGAGAIATCLTPPGEPGSADVRLENLDDAGVPIDGEAVLLPGAFLYERAGLEAESDLTRLVRTLVRALKAQVLPEVSLTVHTDYLGAEGDPPLAAAALAKLPALVLIGPELHENRFYSVHQRPAVTAPNGSFRQYRAPYTVDVGFTLVGVTDKTRELIELMHRCTLFLHKNKHLVMPRRAAAPELGHVAYELDFAPGGQLQARPRPSDDNLRHFVGELVIRGFDIDEPEGIPVLEGRTADAIALQTLPYKE